MGRRRVDLRTAAELLGISSDAVRKRAKRGTMPHETGADGKLYVWVDAGESETYPTGEGRGGGELVDELRARVQSLENQLDKEREASGELRRIIAAMTTRLPESVSLEASSEPRDAAQNATEPRPGTEARPAIGANLARRGGVGSLGSSRDVAGSGGASSPAVAAHTRYSASSAAGLTIRRVISALSNLDNHAPCG